MNAASTVDLLARDKELAQLEKVVDSADRASARLLLLGEPGIGKSSLLHDTIRYAKDAGHRVLHVVGVEAEGELPFAGLYQLLQPIQPAIAQLPPAERNALNAAFGTADPPTPPKPFLVALAALNLVTAAATAEQPIALVLDDVQWLDSPTQEALGFIAGRLDEQRVAFVAAASSESAGPWLEADLPTITVTGVPEEASRQLLEAHAGHLDAAARRQILARSLGNPLALVELPAAWRAHGPRPRADLPLIAQLEQAFASRAAQLTQPARDLLLVMAATHGGDIAGLLAATSRLTGRAVADEFVEEAIAARLVNPDPAAENTIRFRHPLIRSAITHAESRARQRAAHASLAAIPATDRYRRAWHRAMSVVGPNDAIADELAANVELSLARGAPGRAIAEWQRSAQLTANPVRRGHRLLLAAQHAHALGQADVVSRLTDDAIRDELDAVNRARVQWLRNALRDGNPGDAALVQRLCVGASTAHAGSDNDLALNLLLSAALHCWRTDTGSDTRARCAAAVKQLPDADCDPRWAATLACAEPILEARTVTKLLSLPIWAEEEDGDRMRLLGIAAYAIGDTERAANFMDQAQSTMRTTGRLATLPQVLGIYGHLLVELGQFARADVMVAEANRLAEQTRQTLWVGFARSTRARLLAFQGDPDRASRMAEQATPLAGGRNDHLCLAVLAAGAAHLAAGRYQEAFEAHARTFDPNDLAHHWRECFAGVGTMAESAVGAGRVAEARLILDQLEESACVTPAPLLHTHLGYARAVLADDAGAGARYRAALAMNLDRWPLARSRLELAYGEWLLRQDRTGEARERLGSAARVLRRIGASAWERRAREALDSMA